MGAVGTSTGVGMPPAAGATSMTAGAPPTPPGADTGAAQATTGTAAQATTGAAGQATNGTTAGGGTAAPAGAAQAAAGAIPVQGGGAAPDQAALLSALTELVKVLNQLVAALQAQTSIEGGGPKGGGPADSKGGGMPTTLPTTLPPSKVDGSKGGGIVQQSPMQVPIQGGGSAGAPAAPSAPGTPTPPAGAQPTPPVAGGGGNSSDGHAHAH